MRRLIFLIAIAFMIAGGTVGILYQEGVGGMPGGSEASVSTPAVTEEADTTYEEPATDTAADTLDEVDTDELSDTDESEGTGSGVTALEPNADLIDTEAEDEDDTAVIEEEDAEAKAEEEAKKAEEEAKKAKEAKGPFYSVKVIGINNGGLTMHKTASGDGDSLGTAPKDATGYLIGSDPASGNRRLCYIEGKIAYLSKNYTEVTEIDADEYPDALLEITESDAGEDVTF